MPPDVSLPPIPGWIVELMPMTWRYVKAHRTSKFQFPGHTYSPPRVAYQFRLVLLAWSCEIANQDRVTVKTVHFNCIL